MINQSIIKLFTKLIYRSKMEIKYHFLVFTMNKLNKKLMRPIQIFMYYKKDKRESDINYSNVNKYMLLSLTTGLINMLKK